MYHAIIFNSHTLLNNRPMGGYRIASFLREQGWDIEVIEWASWWAAEDLIRLVKSRVSNNTIFFGFSTFYSMWPDNMESFAHWVKQNYPDIKLVLGGQSKPRMWSTAIDYFIHGYAETAILELIKSFVGNTPINGIKFDSKFSNKKVISANTNYAAYPMPSLKIKYEDRDFIHSNEVLGLEFSRGCKFKCIYCNYPILGVKGDYSRTAEDFYDQISETYDRFGTTYYNIADETFNDSSTKIEKFAGVANKLPFKLWCNAHIRADLLISRPRDWDNLISLGILGHFYGVESTNPETLKIIGKGMHPDKLLPGLLQVKEYFKTNTDGLYRGTFAFVVGLPEETEQSQEKTFKWLVDNWSDQGITFSTLEIPLDETQDVLSKLSVDYKKYGYRFLDSPIDLSKHVAIRHGTSAVNWENNHWNSSRCSEILTDFMNKHQNHFLLSGWDSYFYLFDQEETIESFLKLTLEAGSKKMVDKETVYLENFKRYVDKKLSY